jgi:hypothetical protein
LLLGAAGVGLPTPLRMLHFLLWEVLKWLEFVIFVELGQNYQENELEVVFSSHVFGNLGVGRRYSSSRETLFYEHSIAPAWRDNSHMPYELTPC